MDLVQTIARYCKEALTQWGTELADQPQTFSTGLQVNACVGGDGLRIWLVALLDQVIIFLIIISFHSIQEQQGNTMLFAFV